MEDEDEEDEEDEEDQMVPTGSVSQSRKDECMRNASKAIALATTRNQNNLLQ